jgi:hypothetical protein
MRGRDTVIEGHELLSTINGSVTFSATRFRINPGLTTYTWLSERAKGWEQYRFEDIHFVYVPSNAVTTTPGSVYLVADYDPSDPAPSSLAALSTYQTQNNGRVYEKVDLTLSQKEMFRTGTGKKIRCGPVAGDLSLYDAGSVSVGTIDCSNTNAIGQLWVYYRVRLFSPQTESTTPLPSGYSLFHLDTNQTIATTDNDPIEFDTVVVDGMEIGLPSTGVWTMPCGAYAVRATVIVRDSAAEAFTASLSTFLDGALDANSQVESLRTLTADGRLVLSYLWYFTSDGTTTFSLNCQLIGAAGTLQVRDGSKIELQAVAGG